MIDKKTQIKLPCPNCGSANTIKQGINYQNNRQKMLCKDCHKMFQDGKIAEDGERTAQIGRDSHE